MNNNDRKRRRNWYVVRIVLPSTEEYVNGYPDPVWWDTYVYAKNAPTAETIALKRAAKDCKYLYPGEKMPIYCFDPKMITDEEYQEAQRKIEERNKWLDEQDSYYKLENY